MYENTLEKLGLTRNEAKVYQVLLNLGQCTANKIAIEAKIQRRNVYDTVKKLKEKQLCIEIKENNIRNFTPVNPKKLLEIVKEKEELLNSALPKMLKDFETEKEQDQTSMYKGASAIKLLWQDIIKQEKEVLIIGDKKHLMDTKWDILLSKKERDKKNKLKFQVLFDNELKNKKFQDIKHIKSKSLSKKPRPECIIVIYSNNVASIHIPEESKESDNIIVMIMASKEVAQGYKSYFEMMQASMR